MQRAVVFLLQSYKLVISPWLPSACRFYPTCSEYMLECVQRYGATRGIGRGLLRLLRCHPFHQGGYDPVEGASAPGVDHSCLDHQNLKHAE